MELAVKEKPDTRHKLSPEAKQYVLQGLAQFKKAPEIVRGLRDKYQIDLSEHGVWWYSRERAQEIQVIRTAWLQDLDSIPISNKKIRLEQLQKDLDNLAHDKNLETIKTRNMLLEQARKEREALKLDITSRQGERVLTDEELDKETAGFIARQQASKQASRQDKARFEKQVHDILVEDKTE